MQKLIMKFVPIALLVSLSCSDSFLETRPYGVEVLPILQETQNGAETILIGAYSMLDGLPCNNCGGFEGAPSNWIFGSIVGGDAHKGSQKGDIDFILEIERNQTSINDPIVEIRWIIYYTAIQRANDAVHAFQAVKEISDDVRKTRLAEARFLRAYYHYDLYQIFHFVPYIDETAIDTRVSNLDDILPKIQEDLIYASAHLPIVQDEPGRITKGAAQSYLGITYLWQKEFAKAKVEFDSVITSGRYSLLPFYHDNFNADFRNSAESILEVQMSVNDGALGANGNVGDWTNYPIGPVGCCGFHQPTQDLVNAFNTDANGLPLLDDYNSIQVTNDQGLQSSEPFTPYAGNLDPRLDWTVGRRSIPYLDWGVHPGADWIRSQSYGGPYSPIKNVYHKAQESTVTDEAMWGGVYNSLTVKVLRFADLLLYAAEAEVELGDLEAARAYVNRVRMRAMNPDGFVKDSNGVMAAHYVINEYPSFSNQDYARKAVRFERRLELGMEGHRFFDLVRWGVAAEVKNKYFQQESMHNPNLIGATFESGKDEYQPIPQRAINLSYRNGEATLTQNPNY